MFSMPPPPSGTATVTVGVAWFGVVPNTIGVCEVILSATPSNVNPSTCCCATTSWSSVIGSLTTSWINTPSISAGSGTAGTLPNGVRGLAAEGGLVIVYWVKPCAGAGGGGGGRLNSAVPGAKIGAFTANGVLLKDGKIEPL